MNTTIRAQRGSSIHIYKHHDAPEGGSGVYSRRNGDVFGVYHQIMVRCMTAVSNTLLKMSYQVICDRAMAIFHRARHRAASSHAAYPKPQWESLCHSSTNPFSPRSPRSSPAAVREPAGLRRSVASHASTQARPHAGRLFE